MVILRKFMLLKSKNKSRSFQKTEMPVIMPVYGMNDTAFLYQKMNFSCAYLQRRK
jgi:hypothetical protein